MAGEAVGSQADLFGLLPEKPYCTDDLIRGLQIRNKTTALSKRYIQINPPWSRIWMVFDLDQPGAAYLQGLADLPSPCWIAGDPVTGKAHTAFQLAAPILMNENARVKPLQYAAAIEAAITAKLEADESYAGLVTKNPAHAHWRVDWGRNSYPYTLAFLSEWLDLPKHLPRKPVLAGLGRNCHTFDFLRKFGYRHVLQAETFACWTRELVEVGTDFTGTEHQVPLDYREVRCIARSVAKWTWQHITGSGKRRWHQRRQAVGVMNRRKRNHERDQAIIMALRAGQSQRSVAADFGLSRRAIRNIQDRDKSGGGPFTISDNSPDSGPFAG